MRIALGLALFGAACVFACGSSSSNPKGGSAGSAGTGDTTAGSGSGGKGSTAGAGSGADSNGGAAGDIGEGGEGGVSVPVVSTAAPHTAGGLVAGGVIAHSTHFTGIFSLGAAPGGNGVLTSATKQLRGGVIGASQK
jgi:hypothetical protein